MIKRMAERFLRTSFGTWREILYYDGQAESIALVYGDVSGGDSVPCRLHSACISAHVFNSVECDCREQMTLAQGFIEANGKGVLIWLDQDGRGNGHLALMLAAGLAEKESILQTEAYVRLGYPGDKRDYWQASKILHDLRIASIELLSDSPGKAAGLVERGVVVTSTRSVSVELATHPELKTYYLDKIARGYTIAIPDDEG